MNTRHPSIDLRPGTTVLGVWAHPDDEAYLSAGLMLRTVARGGRVVCLHATRGELGTDDPVAWPPDRLAHLREQELARALAVAGVREHEILGLADGECATTDPDGPIRWISAAITRLQPDLVVTFGSDGMTGHPDHVAVSRWTTLAWQENPVGTLVYACAPMSHLERHRTMYAEIDFPTDESLHVPDGEVSAAVALTPNELTAKRRCLGEHASQTVPLAAQMGEERYRSWFDVESFRLPRPSELRDARLVTGAVS
jgi:LmbE family N-acetylglucosaminyl deacetylase